MADIFGTSLPDILSGTQDDDRIFGLQGEDTLLGSEGDDSLFGGGELPDRLNERDTVDYSGLKDAITLLPQGVVNKGESGQDQLNSIEAIIAPLNQENWIDASGSSGKTAINVNLARQSLNVTDIPGLPSGINLTVQNFKNVSGTQNNDTLTGDRQDNIFRAGQGNDRVDGGTGFDTADYSQENAPIALLPRGIITGKTAGRDQLVNIEKIIAPLGTGNIVDASSVASQANLRVDLSVGTLTIDNLPGPRRLDFEIANFTEVTGTKNADLIAGNRQANILDGGGGQDRVAGREGNDRLTGGAGNDSLLGNTGDDILVGTDRLARGEFEQDVLRGGAGSDQFVLGDQDGSYYKDLRFIDPIEDPFLRPQALGDKGTDIATEPTTGRDPISLALDAFVTIGDFSSGDSITLGAGERYSVINDSQGFDIFAATPGGPDLIADVRSRLNVSGLNSSFSLSAGESLGFFIGA